MKIWALTKIGLKECLRQRVVYFIFLISLLFVFMAKGCDIGTIKGESMLIGKEARQGIALGISFHGIVFWSIMLCGLLASQALTRDMDEGVCFRNACAALKQGRIYRRQTAARSYYFRSQPHHFRLAFLLVFLQGRRHHYHAASAQLFIYDHEPCAVRPYDLLPVAVHPEAAGAACRHCAVYC